MEYLGAIYDAARLIGLNADNFYINIKPQAGYTNFISGPIFTTKGRVTSNQDNYKELDSIRYEIYEKHLSHFKEHKPIVFLEANDNKVAHTGDITSLIYKKMGSVGMITDGITRDASIIDKIKYPVFSKETNPIDAIDYWALVDYNCPIEIDGVKISPMDWSFADKDGVMVIPKKSLKELALALEDVYTKEDDVRDRISRGEDIRSIFDKKGRW